MKIIGKLKFFVLFLLLLSNSSLMFYIFPISFDMIQGYSSNLITNITEDKLPDKSTDLLKFGIITGVRIYFLY